MAARKPAGIDMERNYATVNLCIRNVPRASSDVRVSVRQQNRSPPACLRLCLPTSVTATRARRESTGNLAASANAATRRHSARGQRWCAEDNYIYRRTGWVEITLAMADVDGSVLFCSRPRSEGWPHHRRTFSIYLCPLSFWLTLPRRALSTSWCYPPRPCVAFLACVHLALFLALSLSLGNSLVSSSLFTCACVQELIYASSI